MDYLYILDYLSVLIAANTIFFCFGLGVCCLYIYGFDVIFMYIYLYSTVYLASNRRFIVVFHSFDCYVFAITTRHMPDIMVTKRLSLCC
ncbi:uncharacterized protein V1513DRAFT_133824 [Lipomyces chichibuensis]|uniref:uncharacterized protein n=1 Tax=Lipomyces chichibuensis TaxID=1546026 RepID=UPI0033436D6A